MKKITAEYNIKVQFYDLDPMDVVWHGNYIKFLEAARCDLLQKIGYTYNDMKNGGSVYPVAKMDMKFIKSASFDSELKIVSTIESIEPSLNISYEIYDIKTNEKIFKAKTMQIRVDIKTGKTIYEAPERFVKKIEEYKI